MSITDTTHIERVLIVLNPDGSLKGAHQERLREVRDGDVALLSATQLPAEPLTPEALAAVLPQAALAAQAAALVAERDALQEQLAATQAHLAELETPSAVVDGVPQQVTNYQARAALIASGLFEAVDTAVKAQGPASQAWQAWEYANVFLRTSPFIVEMGAALGQTPAQIDALFVEAAKA